MNKKNFHCLALLVVFSLVVAVFAAPAQASITWPNWDEATAYQDSVEDAIFTEDMEVCYVTHDDTHLYFRIELYSYSITTEVGPDVLVVLAYLDVDQNQMTGCNGNDPVDGVNLHDIGAEWKIRFNIDIIPLGLENNDKFEISDLALCNLYKWGDPILDKWNFVSAVGYSYGDSYINIAVPLSELEDPEFPIDILFASYETISGTDYNPNDSHITYPRQPSHAVGGEITPISTLALIPWIALAATAIALGYTITRRKPVLR